MRYELLRDAGERDKLKTAVSRVVQFARQNDVKVLVAVDTAGRPAAFLFEKAWQAIHPDKPAPKIFFLDPYQAPSATMLSPAMLEHPLFTHASSHPDQPVLILDDTSHSGRTLRKTRSMLKDAFKTIYTASLWSLGKKPEGQNTTGIELEEWSETGSPWQKRGTWIGVHRITNTLFEREHPQTLKLKQELAALAEELKKA